MDAQLTQTLVGAGGATVGSVVTLALREAVDGRRGRRRGQLREAHALRSEVSDLSASLHTVAQRLEDLVDRINSEERNRP